jgi:hypothetical protein
LTRFLKRVKAHECHYCPKKALEPAGIPGIRNELAGKCVKLSGSLDTHTCPQVRKFRT